MTLKQTLLPFMLLACLGANAADAYKSIIVSKKDKTTVTVNLSTQLRATFESSNLRIVDTGVDITLPLTDVSGWTYSTEKSVTGLSDAIAEPEGTMERRPGSIVLTGFAPNAEIAFYTTDGRLVRRYASADEVVIPLSDLPTAGIYLLRAGRQTFKIAIR
jgi:hypothetical protein